MKEFEFIIKDEQGIHARPAGLLVKKASDFACDIRVKKGDREVDAKGLMRVMSLGAKKDDHIIVTCIGEGEEEAADVLRAFLDDNL